MKEEQKLLPEKFLPKVTDVCDRKVLSEGRSYQMGFAFCKELPSGDYETIQPLSPCKDYLNDVVYTEHTGKDFYACGLKTKKTGIFETVNAFIAIKILTGFSGRWPISTSTLEEHRAVLKQNHNNIVTLLNYVEEKLGCEERTIITETQDSDMFLFAVPLWWCRSTHLISLWSLLVRMGQFWNGDGTAAEYLENYNNNLDKGLWKPGYGNKGGYHNYHKMVKDGVKVVTPQDLIDNVKKHDIYGEGKPFVHGNGILNYKG